MRSLPAFVALASAAASAIHAQANPVTRCQRPAPLHDVWKPASAAVPGLDTAALGRLTAAVLPNAQPLD